MQSCDVHCARTRRRATNRLSSSPLTFSATCVGRPASTLVMYRSRVLVATKAECLARYRSAIGDDAGSGEGGRRFRHEAKLPAQHGVLGFQRQRRGLPAVQPLVLLAQPGILAVHAE